MVGLVLAGAYHYLSMRLQRWVSKRPVTMLPVITLASFFVRVIVLVGILVALGLWSGLNILAVCIAFVVAFTIMNGIWLYILAKKRHEQPPSAGVTGAR